MHTQTENELPFVVERIVNNCKDANITHLYKLIVKHTLW